MEGKWWKRSHRDVDLYFDGYEKTEQTDPRTGRRRTRYVYRGDYSVFAVSREAWRSYRFRSAALVTLATALFLAAHLLGPLGTVHLPIGLPALLSVIPLCYLWMGLVVLLAAKEPKLTLREYSFGPERMENVLWILLILWGLAAAGEIVFILIKKAYAPKELLAAALELGAFGLMLLQQRGQKEMLSHCIHKAEPRKNTGSK